MRIAAILVAATLLGGSAPSPQTALLRARAEAREAEGRAAQLEAEAATFTSRAARARAAGRIAVARIAAAEAGITAAEARIAAVEARRRAQRVRLAREERPAVTLVAGLQTLARRPPALALIQPGTLDDLVHTRALLASAMPAIAMRTADLRAEIALAERIRSDSAAAAANLRASRAGLAAERARLAAIERRTLRQRQVYVDGALREGDRALALGEDAADIVGAAQERQNDAAVARALARLPEPLGRPGGAAPPTIARRPTYLMPAEGTVLIGAGEISRSGVHARGTTLAVAAEAAVVAPAAGRVVFAGPFRSFDGVVIIDHGAGWTTTITGLGEIDVARGEAIGRGDELGSAPDGRPRITVELRRGGRPVPVASVL